MAVSEAMTMSQCITNSLPPPKAKPETAAMIGFLVFFYLIPGAKLVNLQHIDGVFAGHLFDVGTSSKGSFVASKHNNTYFFVGIEHFEGIAQLGHEFQVQGVELLGAVEPNEGDVFFVAGFNDDVFHTAKMQNKLRK